MKERSVKVMRKDAKREFWDWVRTVLFSILLAALILQVVRPTIVKETSMLPTLQPNDYLMLERVSHRMGRLERGDIVVFKTGLLTEDGREKNLIKRIVGLPGDHVEIKGGSVYVNGERLEEAYIRGETDGRVDLVVETGRYFVMGDNRPVSLDSRSSEVGQIDGGTIMGRALVRLFPFNALRKF